MLRVTGRRPVGLKDYCTNFPSKVLSFNSISLLHHWHVFIDPQVGLSLIVFFCVFPLPLMSSMVFTRLCSEFLYTRKMLKVFRKTFKTTYPFKQHRSSNLCHSFPHQALTDEAVCGYLHPGESLELWNISNAANLIGQVCRCQKVGYFLVFMACLLCLTLYIFFELIILGVEGEGHYFSENVIHYEMKLCVVVVVVVVAVVVVDVRIY